MTPIAHPASTYVLRRTSLAVFLKLLISVVIALMLALPLGAAAASSLVTDTFADGNSQNQDLSNNSIRLFNGRAGTVRADAAGSVNFNIAAAGGSEGFWGFFTDGVPVTLGVGDKLTVSAQFSVQNINTTNLGADMRFGVFDSKGTRTTANTTGGINSPTFTDDSGYATRLAGTAASSTPPFTVHRRVSPSATDPLANVINTTVAEYQALTVTGGSARAPLANTTPYTFSFIIERLSATETKITVTLTDGSALNLSTTATESSTSPATTFDWFGFRVPNGFASDVTFTNWSADYTPAAPVITAQPQPANLTVQVGSDVSMAVAASGSQLSYQWYKNGAPVTGNASATTPTLSITNMQIDDTGSYTAVVSNAGGSVTSTAVSLTVSEGDVAPPPTIGTQPADTTVTVGSPARLSIAAEGDGLVYQWYKNGALIPGATNSTLDVASAKVADAGVYTVVVSNSGGNVTSAPATLLVVSAMEATSVAPTSDASNVTIDALPSITFDQTPKVGTTGKVRIFKADGTLHDTIDLNVDTNTSVHAPGPQSARSIGGSSWQFNYHPIIINGNTATIYPSKKLDYGQTYYITVEPGVVTDASGAPFAGIADPNAWRFTTKASGPAAGTTELTVAADGTGDFNTVQGAIDFVPTNNTKPVTINVRTGTYTEIVYIRSSKPFITVRGENRDATVIQYANNENLNAGSSPRAVFGVDAADFTLENITIHNTTTKFNSENRTRQSEAFRGNNSRILLNRVTLKSFQDTLLLQNQSGNQGAFVNESYIEGDVDFLWGTGPVYFYNSELKMVSSNAYYTQIRNDATKNGYVFVNSRLTAAPGVSGAYLSRIDPNVYPYSQVVFIDSQMGSHIRSEAWRLDNAIANATAATYPNIKFWEYNTTDASGQPVDVSGRHPVSRQLTTEEATFWRNPANVLGGWVPIPVNVSQPATITLGNLTPSYDGQPKPVTVSTTPANLKVDITYNGSTEPPVNAGSYAVVATVNDPNYTGSTTGTLVIAKASARVTLSALEHAYDGAPKPVTVTTEPAGLKVDVTYNGGATVPTEPGTYAVAATVSDPNYAGSATGSLTITAKPNTAPVLALPETIVAEATSAAGATVTFEVTALDAEDGSLPVTLSHRSGSTFPVGTTTVTASATDAGGLTVRDTFSITVRDTTAPQLQLPQTIVAEATSAAGAPVSFTAAATDAVNGNLPVTLSHPSGSVFPMGTTTVTASATDAAGNTTRGTFTVTVRAVVANAPPVLTLPENIVVEATSRSGVVVTFTVSATDAEDGSLPVTLSHRSGSTFGIGTTTVTASATDAQGLTVRGTFTITVRDTTAPRITVPNNRTTDATSAAGATVKFSASAYDSVSGKLAVSATPPSGSVFPIGTTTVTLTAKDAVGNVATASFTVTVRDTRKPVWKSLSATPSTLTANGQMVPVTLQAVVTDAIDPTLATRIVGVKSSQPVSGGSYGSTTPDWEVTGDLTLRLRAEKYGSSRTYTITVESRDDSGNAATKTVTVTVR